jgi:hypothetical protein
MRAVCTIGLKLAALPANLDLVREGFVVPGRRFHVWHSSPGGPASKSSLYKFTAQR